ncbi:CHAT domain-containing protein [Marivirga harenae]|uniref:CHAT domain-containing protein n=1 Tax=Marivirga harenae TaxID=2010992 RepID=UPI0026DFFA65|nr:CHAT domain-containing protein [Marivirga harenae]WKV10901.1 CHAT domain-containing protein [Marivirga harenae]
MSRQIFYFFLLLFIHLLSTNLVAQNLADSIYNDLDQLVESYPSLSSINTEQLRIDEHYSNLRTDEERLALVIMRCNLAFYLKEYEKHYDAIQQYQKAWKLYHSHNLKNYDIIEYCLKPLGNLLTMTGNFAEAENVIVQYMHMAESDNDEESYTAGVINLSVVYNNIGNYQEALELLRSHLKKANPNKNQKELIENNIASNLLALDKHKEVKDKIKENGAKSISALKIKVQSYIEEEEYAAARTLFKEIEKLLIKDNSSRQLAKFYVEEASFYHLISKKDSAQILLKSALNLLLPNIELEEIRKNYSLLYAENTFIDIFDAFALYSEQLNLKLEYFKLSFYVEELLLKKINDPQSKLIFQTSYRKRSEKCLKLLYDEFQSNQNDSLIRNAFEYAENSKTRVLKESANSKSLLKRNPEDSLLIKKEVLLNKQQSFIGELIRRRLSNSEDTLNRINQDFIDLSYQLSEVQKNIEEKYPEIKNTESDLEALQQQLKIDDAQMLYYFYGEQDLYLFHIDENDAIWQKISLQDRFTEQLVHFVRSFESPTVINSNTENYVNSAFELNQILGVGLNEERENLVIVPDGLLSFLPFEALLTDDVLHSNYSKMPFLIRKYKLSYNLSSSFYIENQKELDLESLYGVFPVFKESKRYLKYSEHELELIAGIFEDNFDTYQNATRSNFLTNSNQYDILHLSTHAMGGSFAIPAYIEFTDDVILLPELYSLNLDADLVVLSACETGVGQIIKGATPMSLARGFQYAGVQNILMTQWKVNDFATSKLMEDFYKELVKNKAPSTAIRKAKISYLDDTSISGIEKSPYYWAGFTYYGKIKQEKQTWMDLKYIILLGLSAVIVLLLFYFFSRIKRVKS